MKRVIVTVHAATCEDHDGECEHETFTVSDDGGEFDDTDYESKIDADHDADTRLDHYTKAECTVVVGVF